MCARVGGANTTSFLAAYFALRNTKNGGEGEIRTRGHLAMTLVFKTSALDHYATSPKK